MENSDPSFVVKKRKMTILNFSYASLELEFVVVMFISLLWLNCADAYMCIKYTDRSFA
jgi:hypothetical protein